jgi:hypothetical protein
MAFMVNIIVAQEGCDGPVTKPGGSSGACKCTGTSGTASCGGPVILINTYQSCGGSGAAWCQEIAPEPQIGTSTTCTATVSNVQKAADFIGYEACISQCESLTGDCGCAASWLNPCNWTTCAAGTASPILGEVYSNSGGTCPSN